MWEIFKKLCDNKSVKPSNVAVELGIPTSTISDWKMGRYKPKDDKLEKIANYFNVSLDYLKGRSESPGKDGYWLDEETAKIAQKIFEDKNLRLLFDSAVDSKPEELKFVHDMLSRLKNEERGEA
ncbi:helix-turn-helix transcriptional regulator [bacterium]|nr:helix-turn-helix transcriptional regulator [bacterium]